jgi:hypothetical protein
VSVERLSWSTTEVNELRSAFKNGYYRFIFVTT